MKSFLRPFQQSRKPKVVQIGFNKTGTTSLAHFFRQNNYKTKGVEASLLIFKNLQADSDPFFGMNADLYQDLENHNLGIYIWRRYRELYDRRPDTYFILTTREVDGWINSRLRHNSGRYAEIEMRRRGIRDVDELVKTWKDDFAAYHYEAQEFFKDKGKLYVHSLDQLDVPGLINFVSDDYDLSRNPNYPWKRVLLADGRYDVAVKQRSKSMEKPDFEIQRFIQHIRHNPELAGQIASIDDDEKIIQLAHSLGFNISTIDLAMKVSGRIKLKARRILRNQIILNNIRI
ncbi:MAG: Nif11-like leader peptide family natural product precursor [Cyanobacteria bacterium K_Offshore_surface_m2_239]|nr:Nif11-like leader peptide family natural product precursor [Cyanobacteria bacterium K_Offshore_surface_m2_239]